MIFAAASATIVTVSGARVPATAAAPSSSAHSCGASSRVTGMPTGSGRRVCRARQVAYAITPTVAMQTGRPSRSAAEPGSIDSKSSTGTTTSASCNAATTRNPASAVADASTLFCTRQA
jgi:hypothetical protein